MGEMGWFYLLICAQTIGCGLFAGWEFAQPGGWKWGIFWLLLSVVSMVIVVADYNVFVE